MKISKFLKALSEHNKTGNGYQIHLNSGNLDDSSSKHTDVELGDLYFTECSTLGNKMLLCFGNSNKKPIGQSEDGTDIYSTDINTNLFIDIDKIESVENVKDFQDWFYLPCEKVVNVYMFPENDSMSGCRNVVTIGFMS